MKKRKLTQVECNRRWRHRHKKHARYLLSKHFAREFIGEAKSDDLAQLIILIDDRKKQLSK